MIMKKFLILLISPCLIFGQIKITGKKVLEENLNKTDPCKVLHKGVPFTGYGLVILDNGQFESYIQYKDGCAQEWASWYKNGNQKSLEKGWCCSELGFWSTWYPDGTLAEEGSGDISRTWYKNGQLKSESSGGMGWTDYIKSWYSNGQMASFEKCEWVDDDEVCNTECWDKNGNKISCE